MRQETFTGYISEVVSHIPDKNLQAAITDSFIESAGSVHAIDRCFHLLPTARWSTNILAQFFYSWKASHLKMLAIYGLSCRLQRLAMSMDDPNRQQLFIAAALNAETSYEGLGLDYNGQIHAELYDDFAGAFLGDEIWQADIMAELFRYHLKRQQRHSVRLSRGLAQCRLEGSAGGMRATKWP